MRKLLAFIAIVMLVNSAFAQDKKTKEKKWSVNATADFMSRYVWRGTDFGASPSIQPTLSFTNGKFELGAWGAYATFSNYTETDLYAKYSFKGFTVALTDYYIPTSAGAFNDSRYLIVNDGTSIDFDTLDGTPKNYFTTHSAELSLQYKGPEKFPITILAGTFLYGNDKLPVDTTFTPGHQIQNIGFKNQYSTYFEVGYTFTCKNSTYDVFAGMTTGKSVYSTPLYTPGFAVVNLGITGYRKIKMSSDFELPVKASLICNPQASSIFFVFGFTL
ncbi:MAG: hypothetical protein V2A54_04695 [Bacteroidota bacterium]